MITQYNYTQLQKIAKLLLENAHSKTLCLYGEMGAGKTTLIKSMVKELGGAGKATSPTYGIVNEYHFEDGGLLGYHFDFYRLNEEHEALDLGLEDYLTQDCWVFMEWPEKISSYLPKEKTEIHIETIDSVRRQIRLKNS